jgi:hypothetical protein
MGVSFTGKGKYVNVYEFLQRRTRLICLTCRFEFMARAWGPSSKAPAQTRRYFGGEAEDQVKTKAAVAADLIFQYGHAKAALANHLKKAAAVDGTSLRESEKPVPLLMKLILQHVSARVPESFSALAGGIAHSMCVHRCRLAGWWLTRTAARARRQKQR